MKAGVEAGNLDKTRLHRSKRHNGSNGRWVVQWGQVGQSLEGVVGDVVEEDRILKRQATVNDPVSYRFERWTSQRMPAPFPDLLNARIRESSS